MGRWDKYRGNPVVLDKRRKALTKELIHLSVHIDDFYRAARRFFGQNYVYTSSQLKTIIEELWITQHKMMEKATGIRYSNNSIMHNCLEDVRKIQGLANILRKRLREYQQQHKTTSGGRNHEFRRMYIASRNILPACRTIHRLSEP